MIRYKWCGNEHALIVRMVTRATKLRIAIMILNTIHVSIAIGKMINDNAYSMNNDDGSTITATINNDGDMTMKTANTIAIVEQYRYQL